MRPEAIELAADGDGIPAIVNLVEELGAEAYVYAQLADHERQSVTAVNDVIARIEPRNEPTTGEKIHLRVRDNSILLFDAGSGVRLGAETAAPAGVS